MDILEAKNLHKRYGNFVAVNQVSLSLQDGEILGLLGINGAGKTTTLQMLLGVLTPTSGDIFYFGKNFKNYREEILEQVNFSSTYTNLPWNLTVEECLTFISYLYDIKNRKERIRKIVSLFQLEDLFKQQMRELSAGQLTRVNLAKSFINFPKILLLDEPTASLDPEIASYIRKILLEQREEFNMSIVITSHNMAEVEEVCDRIIFIHKGDVIANDKPDTLAKSIQTAHIELLISSEIKKATEFFEKNNISYKKQRKYVIVDVKEEDIPEFLQSLGRRKITYDEISIEKPTLEDYFIQVAKGEIL